MQLMHFKLSIYNNEIQMGVQKLKKVSYLYFTFMASAISNLSVSYVHNSKVKELVLISNVCCDLCTQLETQRII